MTLLVMPKGVWVEESFVTGGTCQPHPQVFSAYMCRNCSTWGWWPLQATLNLALIHPLVAPNFRQRGIIWVGIATSRAGDTAEVATSDACSTTSATGAEALGTASSGSWGGGVEMVADGVQQALLDRGWMENMGECDMAPLGSLYRPSTSDPAPADSIFSSSSISNCCASPSTC